MLLTRVPKRTTKCSDFVYLVVLALSTNIFFVQSLKADDSTQPTMIDIWKTASERQKRIKNVRVTYHYEWQRLENVPSTKRVSIDPYKIEFVYEGERRSLKAERLVKNSYKRTSVFDASHTLELHAGTAYLDEGKRNICESLEYYCLEFLQIPYRDDDRVHYDNLWFYPHCIRPIPPTNKSMYHLLPKMETVDGTQCYVLDYPGNDRLWVDMKLGGVLRRRDRYASPGPPRWRYEFQDYREVLDGLYVPFKGVLTYFGSAKDPAVFRNKPVLVLTVSVDQIELNDANDSDFEVEIKPGTTIVVDGEVRQVRGDQTQLLSEFAKLAEGIAAKSRPTTMQRSPLFWSLVVLNTVVFFVMAYYFIRAFRKRDRYRK